MPDRRITVVDLGLTDYRACWDLQHRLSALRATGFVPDLLLLTEHPHVYTLGTGSDENHLLARDQELRDRRIDVVETDRGGDVTYHGPGQLVAYPILDLRGYYLDLHRYLRDLEEVVVEALRGFGVEAGRLPGYTGVWIGGEKICAIGIRTSRWVTMHGFALNVDTDLSYFDRIIPCGIFERGVTSLSRLLQRELGVDEVKPGVVRGFREVFDAAVEGMSPADLYARVREVPAGQAEPPA